MRHFKTTSQGVRLWGYTLLVIAAVAIATDIFWRMQSGLSPLVPLSMGTVAGNMATALTGIVTIAVANALRSLERRLESLEARA